MSSYGSMSPDELCDRYEPPLYCAPHHQGGGGMDGGGAVYWPAAAEGHDFEVQDIYHDSSHYIGRTYGYEEMQLPYETHPHLGHAHDTNGLECDPHLCYERPGGSGPSFVRVVKRRSTANKKERRRTQSINTAFSDLRECIPNVPHDTKLSKMVRKRSQDINTAFSTLRRQIPHVLPDTKMTKIKTLRLATSYISYLLKVLETDGEPAGGFRAELHAPSRRRLDQSSAEKRGKGRTGWPQHVWALELKTDQNVQ